MGTNRDVRKVGIMEYRYILSFIDIDDTDQFCDRFYNMQHI